jgi:hypothetical protein
VKDVRFPSGVSTNNFLPYPSGGVDGGNIVVLVAGGNGEASIKEQAASMNPRAYWL